MQASGAAGVTTAPDGAALPCNRVTRARATATVPVTVGCTTVTAAVRETFSVAQTTVISLAPTSTRKTTAARG